MIGLYWDKLQNDLLNAITTNKKGELLFSSGLTRSIILVLVDMADITMTQSQTNVEISQFFPQLSEIKVRKL